MKRVLLPLLFLILSSSVAMGLAHVSSPSVASWEVRPSGNGASQEQLIVRFNRPMNRGSVEERFTISPDLEGSISWTEGTLFFTPNEPFPRGKAVKFSLKEGAQDQYGRALSTSQDFELSLPSQRFVFLNTDGQLSSADLDGTVASLTKRRRIVDFAVENEVTVWYLHQPDDATSTELWKLDLSTKTEQQLALSLSGRLTQLSVGRNSDAYLVATPLDPTQGVPTPYVIDLATGQTNKVALGGVENTLASLSLASDRSTLIASDVDAVQHLRSVADEKLVSLTKLTLYRGSDTAGRKLVFEDVVPDKNYASEVVVYDGVQRRIDLGAANGSMPTLSPNGARVAYSYQDMSPLNQLEVAAGQSLVDSLALPVYGLRVQSIDAPTPAWQKSEKGTSYELPKFSPDGRILAVETFSEAQLGDLRSLREFGEPNKPVYSRIRLIDATTGEFLEHDFLGRELQWLP